MTVNEVVLPNKLRPVNGVYNFLFTEVYAGEGRGRADLYASYKVPLPAQAVDFEPTPDGYKVDIDPSEIDKVVDGKRPTEVLVYPLA